MVVAAAALTACERRADNAALLRAALSTPQLPIRFSGASPADLELDVAPRDVRLALTEAERLISGAPPGNASGSAIARAAAGRTEEGFAVLQEMLDEDAGNGDLLADLAGLRLAASANDAWQIVLALEDAGRALEIAPQHLGARHNRALALERAGLFHRARSAWLSLESEASDSWSAIAAQRRRELELVLSAAPSATPRPALEDLEAWRVLARRDPGAAIEEADARLVPLLDSCVIEGGRECIAPAGLAAVVEAAGLTGHDRWLRELVEQGPDVESAWRLWRLHREVVRAYDQDEFRRLRGALLRLRREDLAASPWLSAELDAFTALLVALEGRLGEAYGHYQAAAESYERAGAHQRTLWARQLAGQTLGELGLGELAWQRVHQELSKPENINSRERHMNLGKTAQSIAGGAPHAAYEFLSEALEQPGEDPANPVVTLLLRAQNALDQGRTDSAANDLARAAALLAAVRAGDYRTILSRWLRLELLRTEGQGEPGAAVAALRALAAEPAIADFSSARILGELAQQLEAAGLAQEAERRYLAALAELAAENRHARAAFRATPAEERRLLDRALAFFTFACGRPEQALLLLERQRSAPARPPNATTIATLADALPATTAAVVFWSLPDRTLAWVVRAQRSIQTISIPVSRRALERAAEHLNRPGQPAELVDRRLESTYSLLIEPLSESLAGVSDVIIVRDGPLVRIPLASLRNPRSERFWIESVGISYAPSLAALKPRTVAPATLTLVAVADPASAARAALPGARAEVARIAELYGRHEIAIGAAATKATVTAALSRGADVLHVAAHAEVFPLAPGESWIVLAPGDDDDGRWTVADISALPATGARLAVVASCSSGLDPGRGLGDGSALAQAFFNAGFRAVLVAKAPVNDRASVELLVDFHTWYLNTRSPAEALRRAQLAAIARGVGTEVWGILEVVSVEM